MDMESTKWQNVIRPQQNCKVEKEGDLIGMLSKQLYLAGDQMQRMQAVLKKAEDRTKLKDQEISRLRRKIKELENRTRDQETANKKEKLQRILQLESSDYIHKQCLKLEHKVLDMEKFLTNYGLIWSGKNRISKSKSSSELSDYSINDYYTKLIANIEELNFSIGKGEMQVCHHQGGATFKAPACMILKFYKNGMIVGRKGRLRPYRELSTHCFIRDILDGYFPSELQREYPNGVAFKVEDHRKETYCGDGCHYPGHGYQLGKLSSYSQFHSATSSHKVRISLTPTTSSSSPDWKQQRNKSSSDITANISRLRSNDSGNTNGILKNSLSKISKLDVQSHDLHNQEFMRTNNPLNTCIKSHKISNLVTNLKSGASHLISKSTGEKLSNFKCANSVSATPSRSTNDHSSESENQLFPDILSSRVSEGTNNIESPQPISIRVSASRSSSKPSPRISSIDSNIRSWMNDDILSENRSRNLRGSKSTMLGKYKSELPILQEINGPTGDRSELRLKIRSMTGTVVYLVHISADDTVAKLYQLLNTVLTLKRTSNTVGYKIVISGYTPKRLDHMNITLRNYGINRDSVLHLVEN